MVGELDSQIKTSSEKKEKIFRLLFIFTKRSRHRGMERKIWQPDWKNIHWSLKKRPSEKLRQNFYSYKEITSRWSTKNLRFPVQLPSTSLKDLRAFFLIFIYCFSLCQKIVFHWFRAGIGENVEIGYIFGVTCGELSRCATDWCSQRGRRSRRWLDRQRLQSLPRGRWTNNESSGAWKSRRFNKQSCEGTTIKSYV